MPLYFAYGSNMDAAAMQAHCPRSRALETGRLARHRLFIMAPGYASIMRDPRRDVHGVIWDVALADLRALDAYEDVAGGLYRKAQQPILRAGGGSVRALVYVGSSQAQGAPQAGYMEQVIAAARAWSLPPAYVRELESLSPALRRPATGAGGAPEIWTAPDGTPQSAGAAAPRPKVRARFATPFDRR
jgi:gamma-glutamylcyclotransferase (GGCT)/AIG2-like uncharacterized protein YtfP